MYSKSELMHAAIRINNIREQQLEARDDELYHYGRKGMKWGEDIFAQKQEEANKYRQASVNANNKQKYNAGYNIAQERANLERERQARVNQRAEIVSRANQMKNNPSYAAAQERADAEKERQAEANRRAEDGLSKRYNTYNTLRRIENKLDSPEGQNAKAAMDRAAIERDYREHDYNPQNALERDTKKQRDLREKANKQIYYQTLHNYFDTANQKANEGRIRGQMMKDTREHDKDRAFVNEYNHEVDRELANDPERKFYGHELEEYDARTGKISTNRIGTRELNSEFDESDLLDDLNEYGNHRRRK